MAFVESVANVVGLVELAEREGLAAEELGFHAVEQGVGGE